MSTLASVQKFSFLINKVLLLVLTYTCTTATDPHIMQLQGFKSYSIFQCVCGRGGGRDSHSTPQDNIHMLGTLN